MNLNQKMTRRQFLGMVGVAVVGASTLGTVATSMVRLPTEGEYGFGQYGNNHYL